jgi:hypothetical protein
MTMAAIARVSLARDCFPDHVRDRCVPDKKALHIIAGQPRACLGHPSSRGAATDGRDKARP